MSKNTHFLRVTDICWSFHSRSQVLSVTQNRACTAKMNLNYYQIIIYIYNSIQHIATVWPANIQHDTHRNFSLTHNIPVSHNGIDVTVALEMEDGSKPMVRPSLWLTETLSSDLTWTLSHALWFIKSLSFTLICKLNRNREAWQYLHPNLHTIV